MNEERDKQRVERLEGHPYRFRKRERLHHRTLVDALYREGKSLFAFPLRLVWHEVTPEQMAASFRGPEPVNIGEVQVMITVPKRKRRHAVDRVLMRRRIREAYRLNRLPLLEAVAARTDIRSLQIGIIYAHTENTDYYLIEKKLRLLLAKLTEQL